MKNTALIACIFISMANLAHGQTYEFNVSCPAKDQYVTDQNGQTFAVYPSAIHGDPFCGAATHQDDCVCGPVQTTPQPRPITVKEMIADQNQYLEKQFAQIYQDHEKLLEKMDRQKASADAGFNNLSKSIRNLAAANRLATEAASKQSKARDQQLLKAINKSAASVNSLSEDLIDVTQKSVENSKSIIEVLQESEDQFSKFQKQVKGSLKSIGRNSAESKELSAELHDQQRQIEELFEALDEDMEEIRERIEKIERESAKRQKSLSNRLKLLEEIRALLGDKSKSAKPKRKKKK